MDTLHTSGVCIIFILAYEFIGLYARKLWAWLHSRNAIVATKGKPTAVCSTCGITTDHFDHPARGGTKCAKCNFWI